MITLRQIRSFVAVYEERSFTMAAEREGATQSGISQHVSAIEKQLDVALFDRTSRDLVPTPAGRRYYKNSVSILSQLEAAEVDAKSSANSLSGKLTAGVIPALAHRVLSPALIRFMDSQPEIEVRIIESYSGVLTDLVRSGDLDFAIIPAFEGGAGLNISRLVRDRELFVASSNSEHPNLQPIRVGTEGPIKIILPSSEANVRRQTLDSYFNLVGAKIERILEMDGMMGTLDVIARSDWVSILPSILMSKDMGSQQFSIRPLVDPPLHAEIVMIQPSRKSLSAQARILVSQIRDEAESMTRYWLENLDVTDKPGKSGWDTGD